MARRSRRYASGARRTSGYAVGRYYDPTTGQFISVDADVDITHQPYAYAGGDPIDNSDPTGDDLIDKLSASKRVELAIRAANVALHISLPKRPERTGRQEPPSAQGTPDKGSDEPNGDEKTPESTEDKESKSGTADSLIIEDRLHIGPLITSLTEASSNTLSYEALEPTSGTSILCDVIGLGEHPSFGC